MGQINTREICLLGPTTQTTTGTGPDINLIQGWQAAIVSLQYLTVSGTTPTLDVFVQMKIGQASFSTPDTSGSFLTGTAIYDDLLHFTQKTTTGTLSQLVHLCTGPVTPSANTTSASAVDYQNSERNNGVNGLAATNVRIGPIGGLWRVAWVIGGTTPSFAFAVTATLIPFST